MPITPSHEVQAGRPLAVAHLAVGPPGIFTINTKNHSGKNVWVYERAIGVGRTTTGYLKSARWEASQVRAIFRDVVSDPMVVAVIAIYADKLDIRSRPPDVQVMDARHLHRRLAKLKPRYDPEQVRQLQFRAAEWAAETR